jgi:tetratricopeptide (TPR) repeat protein
MKEQKTLHIFYCYAREDKIFRDALDKHLSGLKRQKRLSTWSDREIRAGEDWKTAIDMHLQEAHIILCLVSPDFLASDYCYEREMQQALARHKKGVARVIPILVRPTHWEDTPLSELQMLPSDTLAVTLWPNPDAAWLDVVKGILPIIQLLSLSFKTKEDLLNEGKTLSNQRRFEEALIAYEQATRLDPTDSSVFLKEGIVLNKLKRHFEALEAIERAIQLAPVDHKAFGLKSAVLEKLGRYSEALEAIEQAIQLDPTYIDAVELKIAVLNNLGHYSEALEVAERVIRLDPTNSSAFGQRNVVLNNLNISRHRQGL